jgi:lambda family phage portal protein
MKKEKSSWVGRTLRSIVLSIGSSVGLSLRSNATIYSGASGTRLTLDWVATILSADQEAQGNLRLLRARGRELSRNNPIAKNFLNLLLANVVGHKGIGYRPQVRNSSAVCPKCEGTGETPIAVPANGTKAKANGTKAKAKANGKAAAAPDPPPCKACAGTGKLKDVLAKPINDKISGAFCEWSKKKNCTVDGRLSFRGVQETALKNVAVDGEVFIRKVRGFAGNKFKFALQLIDSDQCDHLYNAPPSKDGNEIRMGIEVDAWGRPVAYWITPGHPSDLGGSLLRKRVPAEDIIHLYDIERVSQSRGVTWFHPVMLQLRMLEGYIEAELVAARTGAAKMGWLEYTDAAAYEEPNPDKKFVLEANPGTIETLPPGLTFKEWNPDHPANAFPNFVVTIMRQIATGLGVSYNALASDLIGVNYSSMRSGLLIERDQWKRDQSWMIENLCEPVFEDFLVCAMDFGALVLDARDPEKFKAGKWEPRGWQWVDPLKDAQAAVLSIGANLTSRGRVLADEGEDWEEVAEEIRAELDLAETLDLDLTLPSATKPLGAPTDQSEEDDGAGDTGSGGSGGSGEGDDASGSKTLEVLQ